tara:strand:+ start:169 stop:606 length:438 start_codon:yes stop_codon:yes gene_type:complete
MTNKYTWRQERQMLEDSYAHRLLIEHNIKEVTTQRQAKNETREFEFPVPARSYYINGKLMKSKTRLRLAVYKTGYVRNCNSCSSNYQLNKQYKRNTRWTTLGENGLETKEYTTIARAKILSGLARLNYMLEYYLNNHCGYKKNTK